MRAFIYQLGNLIVPTKESPITNDSEVLINLKWADLNRWNLYIPNVK